MAKLKTIRFRFGEDNVNRRDLAVDVYVSKEGLFYTNFNELDIKYFKNRDIVFDWNPLTKRDSLLSAPTLDALVKRIGEVGNKATSKTLIEKKIIIKYHIDTSVSYCLDEDYKPVPDGSYAGKDAIKEDRYWQKTTITSHAASPHVAGLWFYVRPYYKYTYGYHDGQTTVDYEYVYDSTIDIEKQPNLHWIASIRSLKPKFEVKEMDYTEDAAAFFKSFYIAICTLNSNLMEFIGQDKLEHFIETKAQLKLL